MPDMPPESSIARASVPDFYDMHVALCREKRIPKRTPCATPHRQPPRCFCAAPLAPPEAARVRASRGNSAFGLPRQHLFRDRLQHHLFILLGVGTGQQFDNMPVSHY